VSCWALLYLDKSHDRPTMRDVIDMLEGGVNTLVETGSLVPARKGL
jgi:hypothetical protein